MELKKKSLKLKNFSKIKTFVSMIKFITTDNPDKAALGLLDAAPLAMFALISNALPGVFKRFCRLF